MLQIWRKVNFCLAGSTISPQILGVFSWYLNQMLFRTRSVRILQNFLNSPNGYWEKTPEIIRILLKITGYWSIGVSDWPSEITFRSFNPQQNALKAWNRTTASQNCEQKNFVHFFYHRFGEFIQTQKISILCVLFELGTCQEHSKKTGRALDCCNSSLANVFGVYETPNYR